MTPIDKMIGQISGFLTKEVLYMEKACFIFNNSDIRLHIPLEDGSSFKWEINDASGYYNIYCLKMNSNNKEGLYSFYYNNFDSYNDQIKILPPLKLGQFYQLNMTFGHKIGLRPKLLDNNFSYLTYKTLKKKRKI